MSKQWDSAKIDEKSQAKVEPTTGEKLSDDLAGLVRPPGELVAAPGCDKIDAQAALLGDRRFKTAQRQAMAARIGRM